MVHAMKPFRTFGAPAPGIGYRSRPGVYALASDGDGRFAFFRADSRTLFLPGGGAEPGETQLMTLAREIEEECGVPAQIFEHICDAVEYVRVSNERGVMVEAAYFRVRLDVSAAPPKPELEWRTLEEASPSLAREADAWALSFIAERF
jgi:8-oxo-dGTP diphosphatase